MAGTYDFIIVGAGMMGAAAARHLACQGASVALVGPGESSNRSQHAGVFASHYDEGRLTRVLDKSRDWSRLSQQSIARYRDIEKQGDQPFFFETGGMMAGPMSGAGSKFIQSSLKVGRESCIAFEQLDSRELVDRFPFFRFAQDTLALYEKDRAGYINPRNMVKAQTKAAVSAGAAHFHETVCETRESSSGVEVLTREGNTYHAGKILLAAGYFSRSSDICPVALPVSVYARTIAFFELDEAECARLATMPTLVFVPPDRSCSPYLLPPILYPDGKVYLKIGGDRENVLLSSDSEIRQWFQGDGDPQVRDHLIGLIADLMPDLRYRSVHSGSCVTSYTQTGAPLIEDLTDRIAVLTGGNGAGAKCSDELGRLGAALLMGTPASEQGYEMTFQLNHP